MKSRKGRSNSHTRTQQPELLTVDELAAYLRVNRKTVYDAIRAGTIRAIRIGRVLRVARSEVERLTHEGGQQ